MNKVIISNTSCLIALSRIGHLDILFRTFGKVHITQIIADEYQEVLPEWILIEKINNSIHFDQLRLVIDPGEASAIALALETENAILIIDEKRPKSSSEFKYSDHRNVKSSVNCQGTWCH